MKETTLDVPIQGFNRVRAYTEHLCAPLELEDYNLQPIEDVSPPKWHLGHTTWFFEQFILVPTVADYAVFDEEFAFLFNSYYENAGERVVRAERGNLSRPTVDKVYAYRKYVNEQMNEHLTSIYNDEIAELMAIGMNHEQQHQELLITDIKYILGHNPLLPQYSDFADKRKENKAQWLRVEEGIYEVGHDGNGFAYDNEFNRHKTYLHTFEIQSDLVNNGDYMAFIEAGGYEDFNLWHSEGWAWVNTLEKKMPLYWHRVKGVWHQYTLEGLKPIDPDETLKHISYFEAFAFAQWKGLRLPTEFEWEAAQHLFDWGQRWEWTESAYLPYPGYQKAEGAIGEYNGKFMVNQKVLRGASVATSPNHSRPSYRNFFHPHLRWQFTGIRLAK